MSVTLRRGRKTKKGVSWYLDIYKNGVRRKEYLGIYGSDSDTVALAKRIQKNREKQEAASKNHVYCGVDDQSDVLHSMRIILIRRTIRCLRQ